MATRKKTPDTQQVEKQIPSTTMAQKELPQIGEPENIVMIGGKPIEIKPTKLKYQRNRTALFYKLLDLYPLTDIMAMDDSSFGDGRDGDKCVFDFLIAVTDDEELIKEHYDEMDTETIEKMLSIFKRLNRIDEKENMQKKMIPTAKA